MRIIFVFLLKKSMKNGVRVIIECLYLRNYYIYFKAVRREPWLLKKADLHDPLVMLFVCTTAVLPLSEAWPNALQPYTGLYVKVFTDEYQLLHVNF